jgi:hypothetical protein
MLVRIAYPYYTYDLFVENRWLTPVLSVLKGYSDGFYTSEGYGSVNIILNGIAQN